MSSGEEQARGVAPLLEVDDIVPDPLHGLRVMVRDSLAPVSLALGILYLPLAVLHLLLLARPVAVIMAVAAVATAVFLLGLHLVLARRPLAPRLAHAVGTGIMLLPLANGLLQLGLSRDIAQSTALMLVILGAAYLLPAGPWFFVVLGTTLSGWALLVVISPGLPMPPQFTIAMTGAAGLGLAINRVRLLTLHRLELAMVAAIDREADMNRLFMLSRDLQCLAKLDGTVLRGNPSFIRLEGYREGCSLLDLVDARDHPVVTARLAAAGAGASAFEARLAKGDRWVVWEAVPMPGRGLVHLSGRDITVRRRMEEQLRLSFVAMESAASGIMITDRAGAITWVNPAFTRLTGWGIADVEGRTARVLASGTHPPEVFRELWTTIGAGMVWRGELVNRRRDGSFYTEEQTIAPVRDVDGEITHFVSVKSDVTERRRAEEVLRRDAGRMHRELALAEEVQAGLAPTAPPALEGWRLAATARPARYVSGDLYDWIVLVDGRCLLVMADISGKGVSAAMLSAAARTLVRTQAPATSGPGALLEALNRSLAEELERVGMFITMVAVLVDPRRGTVACANAGHTETLVARRGAAALERLPATAPPLGVLHEVTVPEREIPLAPGDLLLLYSDGATDALDPAGVLFGADRLGGVVAAAARAANPGEVQGTLDAVLTALDAHRREAELEDDVTLLALGAMGRRVSLRFSATLEALDEASASVREIAGAFGPRFAYDTELLASELLTNIVRHACGEDGSEIHLELAAEVEGLTLETVDGGRAWKESPPEAAAGASEETLREGGHGLAIIRKLATTVEHHHLDGGGNRWRVFRARDASRPTGEGDVHGT